MLLSVENIAFIKIFSQVMFLSVVFWSNPELIIKFNQSCPEIGVAPKVLAPSWWAFPAVECAIVWTFLEVSGLVFLKIYLCNKLGGGYKNVQWISVGENEI